MKTTNTRSVLLAFAAASLFASSSYAEGSKASYKINEANFKKLNEHDQQRVMEITARWDAIAHMDRSDLNNAERKELREEVKALKAEAKTYNRHGAVVYFSAASIIIIILLLILIL